MTRNGLLSSLGFGVLFAVAVLVGRLTILDGTSLSLVWPAAGVATLWFSVQREQRTLPLDLALLAGITVTGNLLTGAAPTLAAAFVGVNVVQVLVFHRLFALFGSHLWGAGGWAPMSSIRDLGGITVAALVASTAGAGLGSLALALTSGSFSGQAAAVWFARNVVAVLLVTVVGLRLTWLGTPAARAALGPRLRDRLELPRGGRLVEFVLTLLLSSGAYVLVFLVINGVPIGFSLLVITVWVAVRYPTTQVLLYSTAGGIFAVAATLADHGPFATVASDAVQALVIQFYILVLAGTGLLLALGRDDRVLLVTRLGVQAEENARQRRLLQVALDEVERSDELNTAVLDTAGVGIVVCDAEGRLLRFNDEARRWHGLDADASLDPTQHGDVYGLFRADGRTPLPAAEVPLHRAMADGSVSDAEMVIATTGRDPMLVVCTGRVVRTEDGRRLGAVVVMQDVTRDRARERALREAHGDLGAAHAELAARSRELSRHVVEVETLARATRAVVGADDPRQAICEAMLDLTGADGAYLLQPDENGVLVSTASVGLPPGLRLRTDPRTQSSLPAMVMAGREQLFVADVAAHPAASADFIAACGTVSGVWQPVLLPGGRATGVLGVFWQSRMPAITSTLSALLQGLAGEVAHTVERQDLLARLAEAAQHDALTGLTNRRQWDTIAQAEVARATRTGVPLTFMIVDLDHFKRFNDTFGHLQGDELLRGFAGAASQQLREVDTLARWGGEEFCVALPGCTAIEAIVVADRIRGVVPQGQTCTIGIAQWRPEETPAQVLGRADSALYRGKQSGRDLSVVAPALPPRPLRDAPSQELLTSS
ncbi:diguanylate cyclase domain-containing protein [Kineococcus gynurae]|uniref:Diguanylate cyclase domain-containing protein n=1 Tax=Kineococcus gynurae TaxID=452979 RepID=A0ABV5LNH9_9ACTN